MDSASNTFSPGPDSNSVRRSDGTVVPIPEGWTLLPPGDAGVTRRVKAAGPFFLVQEKKGRRTFSKGIYAPAETIAKVQADFAAERSTEQYAKKRAADSNRREVKQAEYVEDFVAAVRTFLNFAPAYSFLAGRLAVLIAAHATPVGSGTVARTQRIPIERRAEAAVIAWLRHQTTTYDNMKIARIKGERREVRRQLAEQSRKLLNRYRRGEPMEGTNCVLTQAADLASQKLDITHSAP